MDRRESDNTRIAPAARGARLEPSGRSLSPLKKNVPYRPMAGQAAGPALSLARPDCAAIGPNEPSSVAYCEAGMPNRYASACSVALPSPTRSQVV